MIKVTTSDAPDILRLLDEYQQIGSVDKMAEAHRVNVRYVYDVLTKCKIPTSKKICRRLGISPPVMPPTPAQLATRARRARLNEIAQNWGFASWSSVETAILADPASVYGLS